MPVPTHPDYFTMNFSIPLQRMASTSTLWEERIIIILISLRKKFEDSCRALLKLSQQPEVNINEKLAFSRDATKLRYGRLNLDVTTNLAPLKQLIGGGDTLLDVAHRLGASQQAAVLRALLRQLGGKASNFPDREATEIAALGGAPQTFPSPASVADEHAAPTPFAAPFAAPFTPPAPMYASAAPTIPYAPPALAPYSAPFVALTPFQTPFGHGPSVAAAMEAEPAPTNGADLWRLNLPTAVVAGAAEPTVSAGQFPFDAATATWRVEIPRNALVNPLRLRLAPTPEGLQKLAGHSARLDIEACVVPHEGATDGAGCWPHYYVSTISPSAAGAPTADFTLSWPRLGAAALPHAVVLRVTARPAAAPAPGAPSNGELDVNYHPAAAAAVPAPGVGLGASYEQPPSGMAFAGTPMIQTTFDGGFGNGMGGVGFASHSVGFATPQTPRHGPVHGGAQGVGQAFATPPSVGGEGGVVCYSCGQPGHKSNKCWNKHAPQPAAPFGQAYGQPANAFGAQPQKHQQAQFQGPKGSRGRGRR